MHIHPSIITALTLTIFSPFTSAAQPNLNAIHDKWVASYTKARSGVKNADPDIQWQDDSRHYTYRKATNNGWLWMLAHVENNQSKTAFDHTRVARALQKTTKRNYQPNRLPLRDLHILGNTLTFRIARQWFKFAGDDLQRIKPPQRKTWQPHRRAYQHKHQNTAPSGKHRAHVKNGSVFLTNTASDKTTTLAKPDQNGSYYTGKPIWNAQSTHFILYHVNPGERRTVTIVESSPKDQLQPRTHTFRYDKPGDVIDRYEPRVFCIKSGQVHRPDRNLTANASSTRHARWNARGDAMHYEYVERGYGKHYLIFMDAESGKEKVLVKDESDTFIHTGRTRYHYYLPESNEIIWGSETDGWRHLYLLDADTGKLKSKITKGSWVVRKILNVDPDKREIIFSASGLRKDEDPYHIHYCRVKFDGSGFTQLTKSDGSHDIHFSPDGAYYFATWSRVDHPPVHELRRSSDGKKIREIVRTDASDLIAASPGLPERFVCKDRNGRFDIHGIIIKPANFDPEKKYPVIESIYAGPHGAFVPKKFHTWHGSMGDLAEEGFVVVQIDALGTAFRHKDFSHFAYKNLVDSGFPDRIKWIKQAAKNRPWMDTTRVGIYGGSAGGQSSTAALLHHGDFYKAAASDCGCHDNRIDKLWWNEQWMDWPIGPHYAAQSNITNAHKLQGALMLTVGELDKNVDPASTTQLVDALLKAGKTFTYYAIPGAGHGAGERNLMRVRRALFFKKHLGSAR